MAMAINLPKCALISFLYLIVMNPLVVVIHGTILSQNCSSMEGPCSYCWYIFGDSGYDNGNNNDRNTTAKVNFSPYGIDYPGGKATGRFTNEKNIPDYNAEMLGYKTFIPPNANASNPECGVNYASGGGGILKDTGSNLGDVISLPKQIDNHEERVDLLRAKYGNQTADMMLAKCLYTISVVNNDYIQNYIPAFVAKTTPYTPEQFAAILNAALKVQMTRLYNLGARKMAVSNALPPGQSPYAIEVYGNGTKKPVDYISALVDPYNRMLPGTVEGLNHQLYGLEAVPVNVSEYGKILNVSIPTSTKSCCDTRDDGICKYGTAGLCSDRDLKTFFDWFHLTRPYVILYATQYNKDLLSSICKI